RTVVPLFAIEVGLNDLARFAPVIRLIAAENDAVGGPSYVLTAPPGIVLVMLPCALTVGDSATTSNTTLQLPSAGIDPPESDTLFAPATAVRIPPQVVDAFGIGETTMPPSATPGVDGRLSVNARAVIATPFGLFNVIVTVDLPPAGTGVEFCGR